MRRRLLALYVVVSVLVYGTSWVFDGHWSEAEDHSHAVAHTDPGPPADGDHCDHCCHAGAHLLALPPRGLTGPMRSPDTFGHGCRFLTLTRAWDPPFKPPRC